MLETIRLVREQLDAETPLIGFAGAPFTVATYAIEGKTAKSFTETKGLFYRQPELAHRLLALLGETTRDYLLAQVAAGAQAIQIFDSWVGVVSPEDWDRYVLEPTRGAGDRRARQRRAGDLLRQRRDDDPRPHRRCRR